MAVSKGIEMENRKLLKVTKHNLVKGSMKAMKPKFFSAEKYTKDYLDELYASRDSREYGTYWLLEISEVD
jgi:hypothetical protein